MPSKTISFQIDSFDGTTAKDILTLERDAFVPRGSSFLHLTKTNISGYPEQRSVGRVLYNSPVKLWDATGKAATFSTTIRFEIKIFNDDPGDGMTFFIVPFKSTTPTGGSGSDLGIFKSVVTHSPIFAVEFNTFADSTSADRPYRRIGIDINSKKCASVDRFDSPFGQEVTAIIWYDSTSKTITAVVTYGSHTSKVSYVHDLKNLLPHEVQVGISASTGANIALFDLHSWSFTSTLVAPIRRQ